MIPDNETIGAYLKRIREEKKLSIEDVSLSLNLKKDNIEAIESDSILQLLPPAYARGFVSNYAELLELDRHEIIERFDMLYRKETPRVYVRDVGPLKPAERRQKHKIGFLAYIIFILVLAAIAAAVWYQWHQSNRDAKKEDKKNSQESENKKTHDAELKGSGDEPGKGTIVVTKPVIEFSVQVIFSRTSKMRVMLDGTDIFGSGKVFGAGTTEILNAEKTLVIEIEEASNVTLMRNNSKIEGLPSQGKVKVTFDEVNKDAPKIEAIPLESPL